MTREEAIEQLNFMIENMSKEPPTECDSIEEWLDTDKDIRNALNMAIRALEQNTKTGHWIEGKYTNENIRYNDRNYRCSKCCYIVEFRERYCPNCGTKMEV